MRADLRGRTLFWALVALGVGLVFATAGAMPRSLATHFDLAGRAAIRE